MSVPKPYYEDTKAGIVIYLGDCRDILPHLPKVDLVLTDPPYGISHPTNYHERGRDKLATCRNYVPVHEDDQPFDPVLILSLNVPTVLFGANYFANKLPHSSGWLVWDKERPHDLDQATCEMAWTNYVKGARVFRFMWNGMIRATHEPLEHPTQKPTELIKWICELKWTPAGTILDPFMGSGTTLRAAKDLGRQCIGIEIEEKYCEIAARRLGQEVLDL